MITATVPASALVLTTSGVGATPTLDISKGDSTTSTFIVACANGTDARDGRLFRSHWDPAYYTEINPVYTAEDHGTLSALEYLPTQTIWIATGTDGVTSPFDAKILTSGDEGDSWTERTAAIEPQLSFNALIADDEFGAIIGNHNGFSSPGSGEAAQWSANGTTSWTNITSAMEAGLTGTNPYIRGFIARFMYDGDFIYAKTLINDDADSPVSGFILSTDQDTGLPTDNWSAQVESNMDSSELRNCELGESKLINFGLVGTDVRLEWMDFAGSALTLASGALANSTRGQPTFVIYDGGNNWVAMTASAYSWTMDSSVDTLIASADWDASASRVFGTGDEFVKDLFYDKGSDGSNGVGFVAVTENGSGASLETKVYTSDDGVTWVEQKAFATPSGSWTAAGKHPLRATDKT